MAVCYLNGKFVPLAEATVSVLDRGFIFGDGVYELIPVFDGKAFRLAEHLERLENSLQAVQIDNPLSRSSWIALLNRLVHANGNGEQSVYVQVTRGVAPRDHAVPENTEPTVFMMSTPAQPAGEAEPVSAVVFEDSRWLRCDIKSTSLIANVLLRNEAKAAGAFEAILVRDGYVMEGAASNVFAVVAGDIKTAPKSSLLLPGITRDLLIEILRTTAMPVTEAPIPVEELRAADEIWLTSSSREIVPVVSLDSQPVGNGLVGDCCRKVRKLYRAYRATYR